MLSFSKHKNNWILLLVLGLIFIIIFISLLFSGGATALPLVGVWFASMSMPLGCFSASLCLTGVLFITYKILELFYKALISLYTWFTTPSSPVKNSISKQEMIELTRHARKLCEPHPLIHEPSILLLKANFESNLTLFIESLTSYYLTPSGISEALSLIKEEIISGVWPLTDSHRVLNLKDRLIEIDYHYELVNSRIVIKNPQDPLFNLTANALNKIYPPITGLNIPITFSTRLCFEAILLTVEFLALRVYSYGTDVDKNVEAHFKEAFIPQIMILVSQAFVQCVESSPTFFNCITSPPAPIHHQPLVSANASESAVAYFPRGVYP